MKRESDEVGVMLYRFFKRKGLIRNEDKGGRTRFTKGTSKTRGRQRTATKAARNSQTTTAAKYTRCHERTTNASAKHDLDDDAATTNCCDDVNYQQTN